MIRLLLGFCQDQLSWSPIQTKIQPNPVWFMIKTESRPQETKYYLRQIPKTDQHFWSCLDAVTQLHYVCRKQNKPQHFWYLCEINFFVLKTDSVVFKHRSLRPKLVGCGSAPVVTCMRFLWSFPGFDDFHLSIHSDMATVAKAMACPESGLEVRDRMWLKITIANAFIGMSVKAENSICYFLHQYAHPALILHLLSSVCGLPSVFQHIIAVAFSLFRPVKMIWVCCWLKQFSEH